MKKIIKSFGFLLDLLLPPRCFICKDIVYKNSGLCPKCFKQIRFLSDQSCPVCGRPYTFPVENEKEPVCAKCLSKRPKLQALKAVFAYDDFSKSLILPFKHADRTDLVPFLSKLLQTRGKKMLDKADYIIPVPLHWHRLVKRKYNQAALLAVHLEKMTQKPCLLNVLIRCKNTLSQGHKNATDRKLNVKGAFEIKNAHKIKGKNIVLIDDVYTTGATLNECADQLRKAGAKRVEALVLARVCHFE